MHVVDSLKQCPLFADIDEGQLTALLGCLSAATRSFQKDDFVFLAGNKATSIGIVLSGGVRVVQEDFWGHRMILSHVGPSGLFAEAFSCAGQQTLPVSVVAAELSDVMLVDYKKIISTCTNTCIFHAQLILNMMRILAEKNIQLTRKMEFLSKRTTREKLLAFLSAQAQPAGNNVVEIPFNRQELADFLCVDRSALSRELGAMQDEGLLRFDKNKFELLGQ